MVYEGSLETEYFVEIYPGNTLSEKISEQKSKLLRIKGSQYVADDPHVTVIASKTSNMMILVDRIREVSRAFTPFDYEIIGVEEKQYPNGLVEVRTVINPDHARRFKYVHLAVVEASRHLKSSSFMDRYNPNSLTPEQLSNLKYCGFPNARSLYAPHASIGRFRPKDIPRVRNIMANFAPIGRYHADKMIIWKLPGISVDPKETPEKLEEFLFSA